MAIRADDVDLRRDRDLVERFQSGDPRAFEELYERYFDRLCRFCERRVYDRDTAEEIAQEAFYRALRTLPGFGGERRFYPWLTVIARRLCIDHARAQSRVEPVPEVEVGTVPGADRPVVERAALDLLDGAMRRVKPRHKEVLTLRDDEGLSYQAIGDRIQAPVTTVEALLHRARRALRRELVAAAGPGAWASLPAFLWIRRVAGRLRARLAEHQGDLSVLGAPLAAAVASVSLAVAPGSGFRGVPEPGAPLVEAPAVSGPGTDVAPLPPVGDGADGTSDTTSPRAVTGPTPPPDVAAGPVRVYFGPEGAEVAKREAQEMPIYEQIGPAYLGADPTTVIDDVADPGALPDTVAGEEPCVLDCPPSP